MSFSSHFWATGSPKLAAPGRRQWPIHCGTNILQRPEWSRKNTPLEFVWVLARRLGLGLAGVGKGNPPQKLKNEVVSAPTHLTGLEWCVEALCKCTRKMLSETMCLEILLSFFFIYFYHLPKFRV